MSAAAVKTESVAKRPRQAGFTVIELLIATLIVASVTAGMVGIFRESQESYLLQTEFAETAQQLRIAMDQMTRYLRQAGNDPLGSLTDVPPIAIIGTGHIRVNSDITGSIPSTTGNSKEATGDPDGRLDSIYERVTIRYDQTGDAVFVDVGYGEELVARRISRLDFRFLDGQGAVTTDPRAVSRIQVSITGESENKRHREQAESITLRSEVYIRNKAVVRDETEGGEDREG